MRNTWLGALQQYNSFGLKLDHLPIAFQSQGDPILIQLAERFQVGERYVGNTDLDKILALMDYVHHLLAIKAGSPVVPAAMNTDAIARAGKQGALFCSGYATALAELLLCVGVKAVVVFCMPFEFDYDRHVGTLAYINDSGKWAYFDPTFNTYFYGEGPLDILEIREAYVGDKPPAFRPIAIEKHWKLVLHNVEYETYDQWYADYMLKNTFRFMVPAVSSYDYMSREHPQTIYLSPVGYAEKNAYDA